MVSEYNKRYREEHKEELKQKKKNYYQLHKEEIKQQSKEYYNRNKETAKQTSREYYQKHREEVLVKNKQYRMKNIEHVKNKDRKYYETHKEHHREVAKIRYEKKKIEIRQKNKEYNSIHREEKRIRDKKYRETHREQINATKRISERKRRSNPEVKLKKSRNRQRTTEEGYLIISKDRGLNGICCHHCGEKDIFKLTVAHLNNDGGEFRKTSRISTETLIKRIVNGSMSTDGLSLECFNCNWCLGMYGKYPDEMTESYFFNNNPQHRKLRLSVFKKIAEYVGRPISCRECGENRPWVLNIAHVNNDGYKEGVSRTKLLSDIHMGRRTVEDLDIECCNCNMSKCRKKRKEMIG